MIHFENECTSYVIFTFQALILGSLVTVSPLGRSPNRTSNISVKFWIAFQALFGALRLYFNFACLQYLPLGDALTIIFTEPLFTVVLSFILLKTSIGFIKFILCLGLLTGMMLSIQPPFMFNANVLKNNSTIIDFNLHFNSNETSIKGKDIFDVI